MSFDAFFLDFVNSNNIDLKKFFIYSYLLLIKTNEKKSNQLH